MCVASLKQVRCAPTITHPGDVIAIDVQVPEVGYRSVVPAQDAVTTIYAILSSVL